jgi:hypothetical protein
MAETGIFTPYSTARQFFGTMPSWVPPADQERIASYDTYEQIYWSVPETFKLMLRGTENKPIYLPSGRVIVDTANRYIGKKLRWVADPTLGEAGDQQLIMAEFNKLFRRESFASKYNSNKRYGIMKGDWIFHVTADPLKPQGERISIHRVDAGSYFPVTEDMLVKGGSPERIVRVHLAEQFIDTLGTFGAKNKVYVRRQTYTRVPKGDGTYSIESSTLIADPDKWFDDTKAGTMYEIRPFLLDPLITQIPVFAIQNFDEPGNLFGSSEMRGMERVMAAMNQAVSDNDIALALEGLGLYATESPGPVDEEGKDVDWIIGPGRVLENVKNFQRVNGVGSVKPSQDHVHLMYNFLKEASGTPDVAIGNVDVTVAESGIALALQMGPMLAKAEEKDTIIVDRLTQMAFNIATMWFPVYEGISFGEAQLVAYCNVADKLPADRVAVVDEVVKMMSSVPPLMSATTGRQILSSELAIPFASNELERIIQEAQMSMEITDPQGSRMDEELDGAEEEADPEV